MAAYTHETIYRNFENKIVITSAISNKGDSTNVPIGETDPIAFPVVVAGSVRVYDAGANFWADVTKGNVVNPSDWATHYATGACATIVSLEDGTAWYCIMDPAYATIWTGLVHTLQVGEDVTISQGNRVFLASSDGVVDGVLQDRHILVHAQSKDIVVAANADELICLEFWDSAI